MNNRKVSIVLVYLLTLSVLLTSCNSLPRRTFPEVLVGENTKVRTVCLKTSLIFPEGSGERAAVDIFVKDALTSLGLNVVIDGTNCDADLSLNYTGTGKSSSYSLGGVGIGLDCFTGGRVFGTVSLSQKSNVLYSSDFDIYDPPSDSVTSDICNSRRKEGNYPFQELWIEPTVDRLVEIWGPRVLVWLLPVEVYGQPNLISNKIEFFGPSDKLMTELIYALNSDDPEFIYNSAIMLREFGNQAKKALPYLEDCRYDENIETYIQHQCRQTMDTINK